MHKKKIVVEKKIIASEKKIGRLSRIDPAVVLFSLVQVLYTLQNKMSAPEGDYARGEALFKGRCAQCHTANKVTSLYTVIDIHSLAKILS